MMSSLILFVVAAKTGDAPNNWEFIDGPTTGVGVEYWLKNIADRILESEVALPGLSLTEENP